ncbi:MAG: aromatic ring-hydroxylating dioxygenase subunit alpha [Granulosicoccus sp.]
MGHSERSYRSSALASVCSNTEHATGLPNEHYTSPSVFDEERDTVLFNSWTGIGFGKDIPEPGDARPIDFISMPLLVLRDHEGVIQVFQNTCRHRGMILLNEPKRLRNTLRCPYHSWCYGLNGELKATPHVGGPGHDTHALIDQRELGLVSIRSYVWRDVIFVNISGDAPAFEEVHADILSRWNEFDQPVFHGGANSSFTLDVKCNWKLAVENFCESYHLPWIHPDLNSYSRLEDHYDICLEKRYSGQGSTVYRQLKGDRKEEFADFPGLSEKWMTGAEYVAIYPNVLLGVHRDHCFAIILDPISHQLTSEHIEIYYARKPTNEDGLNQLRIANASQWKTVFEEDIQVVEGMQRGRHGVLFDGGRFSPVMDMPNHNFHHWIADLMDNARGNRRTTD